MIRTILIRTAIAGVILAAVFLIWFYLTPSGTRLRYMAVDTILSTQHREWAQYLIGARKLQERLEKYDRQFDEMAVEPQVIDTVPDQAADTAERSDAPLVTVEEVSGQGYKGYLLSVADPKKIRLVVPQKSGKGELVTAMVERTGAVAGVNAGGFDDPNGMGNGFLPIGIIMSGGVLLFNDGPMDKKNHVVGIDGAGQMIAGKYSPRELQQMNVKEAVTFAPRLIVNGKGLIASAEDGWGIAPRTAMAQKADGTILFAVIDGRQTRSLGASLYDVQQLLLDHGAVIAANLDGGASTILVNDGRVVNSPASEYGERPVPSAFLVYEHPESVRVGNPWEHVVPSQIDPMIR